MTGPYFLPRYYEEIDDELIASVESDGVDLSFIDELPRLAELKGKLSEEEAEHLLQYMKACPFLNGWMHMERDPFSDDKPVISCSEFTDGIFIWRDMHMHLVETYRVAMPPKFMNHVRAFDGIYDSLGEIVVPDEFYSLKTGFGNFIYDQIGY